MQFYSPLDYIKIDIASQFGLDKELFETRIDWTNKNNQQLENLREKADDPDRYIVAVMALRDTQAGKPTGHLVGLDVCSSGPQIMSAITNDPIGALNTGLIGDQRADLYGTTTAVMRELMPNLQTFDRKLVKSALMPHYYGSVAEPKNVFGEDTEELAAFYEAQAKVCPGAAMLMPIMINAWQPFALKHCWTLVDNYFVEVPVMQISEDRVEVDELDHATFTYQHKVVQGELEGVALAANIIQSLDGFIVREMSRRCNYQKEDLTFVKELLVRRSGQRELNGVTENSQQKLWAEHKFLSLVNVPSFTWKQIKKFDFGYCDALIELIDRCLERPSFPVLSIHDEFKAHPNYMNYIRLTYAEILAEIAESCMIDAILSEITGKPVKVQQLSSGIGNQIRKGNYALS